MPGRVAQSVTCLNADMCTVDPGIPSSIPAPPHTFMEIDHEIISTAILLPSADSRTGFAQAEKYLNIQDCLEKSLKIKFTQKVLEKHSKALKSH